MTYDILSDVWYRCLPVYRFPMPKVVHHGLLIGRLHSVWTYVDARQTFTTTSYSRYGTRSLLDAVMSYSLYLY